MTRSCEEIKTRCKTIMNDKRVIELVKTSSSPTAAFDMIMDKTGNEEKAKAGRWLAILRRDYLDEYVKLV